MIGMDGVGESGKSMLSAPLDDDEYRIKYFYLIKITYKWSI